MENLKTDSLLETLVRSNIDKIRKALVRVSNWRVRSRNEVKFRILRTDSESHANDDDDDDDKNQENIFRKVKVI